MSRGTAVSHDQAGLSRSVPVGRERVHPDRCSLGEPQDLVLAVRGSFEQDRAVQTGGGTGHRHPRRMCAERGDNRVASASIDEAHLAKMAVEPTPPDEVSERRLFDRRDADAPTARLRHRLDERWREHEPCDVQSSGE